jgi:hypothetical protein
MICSLIADVATTAFSGRAALTSTAAVALVAAIASTAAVDAVDFGNTQQGRPQSPYIFQNLKKTFPR